MRLTNSLESYGAVPKLLHWTVAVLVLAAWALGMVGEGLPRGIIRDTSGFIHISAGLAIFILLAFRLVWRLYDPPSAPEPTPFGRWGEYASRSAHWLLYALLVGVLLTGILSQFADGKALPLFGVIEVASPWARTHDIAESLEQAHEFLANALLIVAAAHAAAAFVHHFILRDRTLIRMLPHVTD